VSEVSLDEPITVNTPTLSKENKSILDRIFPIVDLPLPDTVSEETILELQDQIPPKECFKGVQKISDDRCGYYAILGATASIGNFHSHLIFFLPWFNGSVLQL